MPVAMIDLTLLAEVRPTRLYSTADVARLFGRCERSVRDWCRAGKLAYERDPIDPRRYLVRGSAILARAGGLLATAAPPETETERERDERARRAREHCRRLVRERAKR